MCDDSSSLKLLNGLNDGHAMTAGRSPKPKKTVTTKTNG